MTNILLRLTLNSKDLAFFFLGFVIYCSFQNTSVGGRFSTPKFSSLSELPIMIDFKINLDDKNYIGQVGRSVPNTYGYFI